MVDYLRVTLPKGEQRWLAIISEEAYNAMPYNSDFEVVTAYNDQNKIRKQISLVAMGA